MASPADSTYEFGYKLAYKIAWNTFSSVDIVEQCRRSDAEYLASKRAVKVPFLARDYLILLRENYVVAAKGSEEPSLREKILVLHYFLNAKGTPPSGNTVTYKELKEGINYFPVFHKRVISPIINFFGAKPESLAVIAGFFGGVSAEYGDVAVTINAFPRVPVTYVLWRGDDDFPPQGSVMFDSNVNDYFTNDDIHALCEVLTWKIVRLLKTHGD
ncbi:DUF3786 domain-containing protein [Chloroflexota bacterium]